MAPEATAPRNPVGEGLLAAVGIDAVLEPGPVRVTVAHRDARATLPGRVRRELRRFLTGTSWDKAAPLPAFNYKKYLNLLTTDMSQEAVVDNLKGFDDPDEALAFSSAASAAITYLQGILPKRSRNTTTGPQSVAPSDQEISRFRRAHAVVQDPMLVLADLNEGALSIDQVKALEAVYPSIYDFIKQQIFLLLADVKAARPRFELPHARDKQLQTLLQTSTFNAQLARDMQKAFADEAKAQQAAAPKKPLTLSDAKPTSVQRISSA